MSQDTSNTTAFIEAQQYSQFIVENLPDMLLPDMFTRDVSDFGAGTTLNIKTIGSVTIQDVSEGTPLTFNPISTGTVTLAITEYTGAGWAISDELRQDGAQIDQLSGNMAMEATRALAEDVETKFLKACNDAQTDGAANNVNGFAHRIVSGETNDVVTIAHFVQMKLAFDKANVPAGGRVALVDPVVEATLNDLATVTIGVDRQPAWQMVLEKGFAQDHKFVMNIMGWDIYTSNMLDKPVSIGDGTQTIASSGGVANVFMSVLDDNTRPIMRAWRLQPTTEGWRDPEEREDKFQITSRFGFGAQRDDTLGILGTSNVNYT